MSTITLTPDQVQILNQSPGAVVVLDPTGKVMGQIAPCWFTPERIADAELSIGNKEEPVVSADDVVARLRSLAG